MSHMWTKKEDAKVLSIIQKSTTFEAAVASVAAAFSGRSISLRILNHRLAAMGKGSVTSNLAAPLAVANATRDLSKLVAHAKAGRTMEEICNALDAPPKRVRALVELAQAQGLALHIHGPHVGIRPSGPAKTSKVAIPAGATQSFMVASDIHIGSNHFLKDHFLDFIHRGYEKGIRLCLVPGDIRMAAQLREIVAATDAAESEKRADGEAA